jgi:hypothetical protein
MLDELALHDDRPHNSKGSAPNGDPPMTALGRLRLTAQRSCFSILNFLLRPPTRIEFYWLGGLLLVWLNTRREAVDRKLVLQDWVVDMSRRLGGKRG